MPTSAPRSGSTGETSRSTSVKNSAAPGWEVTEIISPPSGPKRNQCVEPRETWTSVPAVGDEIVLTVDAEDHVAAGDIERLVPRMAVRRRPTAFGTGLAEDLVAAGRRPRSEDRDLFAHDSERTGSLVGLHDEGLGHRMAPIDRGAPPLWSTRPFTVLVYHEGVMQPSQDLLASESGRVNQKRRTRKAIVDAARAIVEQGGTPTVAQAAEAALVSRTTAYRYFPTQESLLLELSVTVSVDEIETLLARPADDGAPRDRLLDLVDAFSRYTADNEALMRTAQRHYLDTWLAAERTGEGHHQLREGRRRQWTRPRSNLFGARFRRRSGSDSKRPCVSSSASSRSRSSAMSASWRWTSCRRSAVDRASNPRLRIRPLNWRDTMKDSHCPPDDTDNRQRSRYFEGKLLTAEDFEREQDYHRAALRRHNLGLHGWGVHAAST